MRVDMSYDGPSFEPIYRNRAQSTGEAEFSCRDKKRYETQRRASVARRWVERTLGRKIPYFCLHCAGYHLGSK